jgi:RNA polymerase sigma factor (sigma-70 family)
MTVPSPGTSASLLDQLRDQTNSAAWQKLVAVYTPLMRAWLRSAGLQAADLDDLVQRTLEVVVRKLALFIHNGRPGAFRSWLRAITVNVLREFWRDQTIASPAEDATAKLDELEDPQGNLSRWWDSEHNNFVLHGLMKLVCPEFTPATWQAFRRQVLDGAPAQEAAMELGITVNAALIAKSRVLARLRQEGEGLLD